MCKGCLTTLPVRSCEVGVLITLVKREDQGPEKLSDLPKVIQQGSGRAGFQTHSNPHEYNIWCLFSPFLFFDILLWKN